MRLHWWKWLAAAIVICFPAAVLGQAENPPSGDGTPPAPAAAPPAEPPPAESRTQKWEFGVSIHAVGGPCAGLFATFPVPADWPEQQVKVVGEEITPSVRRHTYREIDGLKQMLVEVPQLPAGGTATCFLTFEVTKHAQAPPADPAALAIPKEPPRDVRKWLGPSPLIESTNARIRTLARELTADKPSAWEQVQALVSGVRERVQFDPDNKDVFRGAVGALRDGKADREDMTAAFVALCRAAKIPARMVWVLDYCYAEFFLEDAAGKGAWYPCVVHEEVPLGECRDFRPIWEKGDNFRVPEERAPQRFVREYVTGKGGGGKPSVEFRRHRAD
jgi:hypothetical protein